MVLLFHHHLRLTPPGGFIPPPGGLASPAPGNNSNSIDLNPRDALAALIP